MTQPSKPFSPLPYERTTYLLGCPHTSNPARLDFKSSLALEWVQRWVTLRGGLKTPTSGVIRRALTVYVNHLGQLAPELVRVELLGVKTACSGTYMDAEEQSLAAARMEATEGPLEPFEVVLRGRHQVEAERACMARLEHLNSIPISTARTTTSTTRTATKAKPYPTSSS